MTTTLLDPETPFAVVDKARLDRNIARLRGHLASIGVPLRLHVKTCKSTDVAARVFPEGPGPITVSTLSEAEHFADAGYTDILYAVGIDPHKLPRVIRLIDRGIDLVVLLDSTDQANAVAAASRATGTCIPALIEVDCDGHRGGVRPESTVLVEIGRVLESGGAELRGVLDHAGESYFIGTKSGQVEASEEERVTVATAADALRSAGLPCPVVSLGSTPTAHALVDVAGVTEVRAGNFVFFDLVMAGIGVCETDDLALSVVATVIGHRPDKGWILTDGGWMAMSRDRGTAAQQIDQGDGLVADLNGRLFPDLLMSAASQEHGILTMRAGTHEELPHLPIGTRVRVFPNHACATAAQHERYAVVTSAESIHPLAITAEWPRSNGW